MALEAELREFGVTVGDREVWPRLGRFLELVCFWGSRFNLTAIRDPKEGVWLHLFDSLSCLPLLESVRLQKVADMGSGAGFPGIPIKIALPYVGVVLIERSRRKVAFLERVCLELGLRDVVVVWGRAEEAAKAREFRGGFDVVTARAFGGLRRIWEVGCNLLGDGGRIIAFKGPAVDEELEGAADWLRRAGATVDLVREVTIPRGYGLRRLVVLTRDERNRKHWKKEEGIEGSEN